MRIALVTGCVALCLVAASCLKNENSSGKKSGVQSIEERILKFDSKQPVKKILVELGMIKEWTAKVDEMILIDVDYEWDKIERVYRADGFSEALTIEFSGISKSREAKDSVDFEVNTIVVSHTGGYQIYRWKDGAYHKSAS